MKGRESLVLVSLDTPPARRSTQSYRVAVVNDLYQSETISGSEKLSQVNSSFRISELAHFN